MYHYDAAAALDELNDDALLPNPVNVRDMMIRSRLDPDLSLELNRKLQSYMEAFGEAQSIARSMLEQIAAAPRK